MTLSKTEHELEELLRAATPLPWKECGASRGGCVCGFAWDSTGNFPVLTTDTDSEHEGFRSTGPRKVADAAFIVAAVNALPALLAERKRLLGFAAAIVDYDDTTKVAVHETGDLDAVLDKWRRVTDLARSLLPIPDDSLAFAVKSPVLAEQEATDEQR